MELQDIAHLPYAGLIATRNAAEDAMRCNYVDSSAYSDAHALAVQCRQELTRRFTASLQSNVEG